MTTSGSMRDRQRKRTEECDFSGGIAVATIWLGFYLLALGHSFSTLFVADAIGVHELTYAFLATNF